MQFRKLILTKTYPPKQQSVLQELPFMSSACTCNSTIVSVRKGVGGMVPQQPRFQSLSTVFKSFFLFVSSWINPQHSPSAVPHSAGRMEKVKLYSTNEEQKGGVLAITIATWRLLMRNFGHGIFLNSKVNPQKGRKQSLPFEDEFKMAVTTSWTQSHPSAMQICLIFK